MPGQWATTVVAKEQLTPHMLRIVLGGEALREFPPGQESGYVKLLLEEDGKPLMRSYTIRAFDQSRCALTLDFVDHGDTGPASRWARSARLGDALTIRGPGERKLADSAADWFLFAADMSALPALAVNLKQLARDAQGYAFMEVLGEADRQPLDAPPGIEVQWLVNPRPESNRSVLSDAVRAAPWLPGRVYPWFAGEFDTMRDLRRYFRDERQVDRRAMYLSSYWKIGATDEGMKAAKKADTEA